MATRLDKLLDGIAVIFEVIKKQERKAHAT
jgi:hypothetical protein